MAPATTIVFGPTGDVASAVAREVHQRGAKVVLAMRNTSKPIPGLSPQAEAAGNFERVQADLTDPQSITAAVSQTGATRAFLYVLFGNPGATVEAARALRSAGVGFVVLLSSFDVRGEARAVPTSNFLGHMHAVVEVALEELFGAGGFVALRPAFFASNSLRWKSMVREGHVKMPFAEAEFDWISNRDVAQAAAAVLIRGSQEGGQAAIELCGPKLFSQEEAVNTVARVLGREIKVTRLEEEDAVQLAVSKGTPERMARLINGLLKARVEGEDDIYAGRIDEAQANGRKYTGGKPVQYEEWVRENKDEFEAET